ncbi:hypothetical protein FC85_GL001461 [Lentilactobacillus diolivorans DSM 14421]|uniref:Uncharacterized protein n=1 Tax=Lentilactobacillus diolivorans DSM 14421 TaxID=1423739 RepID=A0A0R1SJD3_9LACO|nr:hypothetical protein FC85_GL001461 [Lentilactobacillus diolivorans DSM 14421]
MALMKKDPFTAVDSDPGKVKAGQQPNGEVASELLAELGKSRLSPVASVINAANRF